MPARTARRRAELTCSRHPYILPGSAGCGGTYQARLRYRFNTAGSANVQPVKLPRRRGHDDGFQFIVRCPAFTRATDVRPNHRRDDRDGLLGGLLERGVVGPAEEQENLLGVNHLAAGLGKNDHGLGVQQADVIPRDHADCLFVILRISLVQQLHRGG